MLCAPNREKRAADTDQPDPDPDLTVSVSVSQSVRICICVASSLPSGVKYTLSKRACTEKAGEASPWRGRNHVLGKRLPLLYSACCCGVRDAYTSSQASSTRTAAVPVSASAIAPATVPTAPLPTLTFSSSLRALCASASRRLRSFASTAGPVAQPPSLTLLPCCWVLACCCRSSSACCSCSPLTCACSGAAPLSRWQLMRSQGNPP
mmetsp:Transcript_6284/g.13694  ORF Transcript_6284/g.13694 Transcript_6284/m.13694 type:complete len:207 (-) Transcript_6284:200-820(-)